MFDNLEKYKTEQELKHTALFNKIESLLPGATSVGLSKAYTDLKDSFGRPIIIWSVAFVASLAAMLCIAIYKSGEMNNVADVSKRILSLLPIYLPLLWFAMFSSKRRSENKRLQQEYAHKEALAKSYDSYRLQLEELKEQKQELLAKLLGNAINSISYNASETLDKKHDEKTPIQEIIKSGIDELSKKFGK